MDILWLAIVFYSIGLAAVLHLRPTLMFHANGTWKEFGYQRDSRYTIFPFWLFAIVWAVVSYVMAASVRWLLLGATVATAAAADIPMMYATPESEPEPEPELEFEMMPEPIRRGRGRPRKYPLTTAVPTYYQPPVGLSEQGTNPRPGYYVLDPETRESGLHKYVYYGPQAPQPQYQMPPPQTLIQPQTQA